MRTPVLTFPCKRPNVADVGGGGGEQMAKFCGRPLWMAPKASGAAS